MAERKFTIRWVCAVLHTSVIGVATLEIIGTFWRWQWRQTRIDATSRWHFAGTKGKRAM